MINVFAYGTLMAPDIMEIVSGRQLDSLEAMAKGYQRYLVHNEKFPGMVEQPGAQVQGVLYLDVSEPVLMRLDLFEGELYDRQEIEVFSHPQGQNVMAMTYLFKEEYSHLLSNSVWDFEEFLSNGKQSFTRQSLGIDNLHPDVD